MPSFLTGEVLDGRFRILGFLGQGGMGQVYRARDLELGVDVALKAIRPERCRSPQAIARFKREVQLARQVTHRNVCRIFDLFQLRSGDAWGREAQPHLLVTMELLEGETLAQRLRRKGPMSPREALPVLGDLARALDTAHDSGVLHLDLKSSNVMLVDGGGDAEADVGRAVVTDFGLARTHGADSATEDPRPGGTPAYAAPELARGAVPAATADLYSFAVVIFEVLTGELPPRRHTGRLSRDPGAPRGSVLQSQEGTGRDPWRRIPPAWRSVLRRCLSIRPEDRRGRAGEVVRILGRGLRRSRWRPLAAGAAVTVLGWVAVSDIQITLEDPESGRGGTPAPIPEPLILRGPDLGRPEDPRAASLVVRGLWRLGAYDLPAACEAFEQAAALAPSAAAAQAGLARCWLRRGNDRRAEGAGAAALAAGTGPGSALDDEARRFLGALAAETARDFEGARGAYADLWDARPDIHEYGLRLARMLTATGDPVAGLEVAHQVRADFDPLPVPARVDLVAAIAARGRGDLRRQLESAERAARSARAMGSEPMLAQARLLEGEALDRLGERIEASTAVAEARWIFESVRDRRNLALADLALQPVVPMASPSNTGLDYPLAVSIFRQAGDRSGEALALARWGRQLVREDEPAEAQGVLDRGLSLAREIGDLQTEAEAVNNLAVLRWAEEDTLGAARGFEQAVAAAKRSGNLFLRSRALANLGNSHMDLQQLEAARDRYGEALQLSADLGTRYDRGMLLVQHAWAAISLGQVDDGERHLREAIAIGHEIPHAGLAEWAESRLAEVDACRGNFDRALERFDDLSNRGERSKDIYHVIARSQRLLPISPERAEAELRAIASQIEPEARWALLWHRLRLAWALLDQDRTEEAVGVLRPHRAEMEAHPEPGIRQLGRLLWGRVDAAAGRLDGALRGIDGVVEEAEARQAVLDSLKARGHRVRALFAGSRPDLAAAELRRLAADAGRVGCPGIAIQAGAGLAGGGG
ncbi:MAG: protein kinase [Acidobacteriota bacterium]